jgi:hypothetical protein
VVLDSRIEYSITLPWTGKIMITSIYSFVKHLGAANEDWYHGYLTTLTRVAQGGALKDSAHLLEDSRWSERVPKT